MTTPSILAVSDRKLPTFKEWIETHSPGTQAEGFSDFADLAYRSQTQLRDDMTEQEKSFGRMWMGACVAAVELCNMEAIKHNRSPDDIVATLPRVFAAASMYALASVVREDTPWRDIAKILTEEFRMAAKTTADNLSKQFPRN